MLILTVLVGVNCLFICMNVCADIVRAFYEKTIKTFILIISQASFLYVETTYFVYTQLNWWRGDIKLI